MLYRIVLICGSREFTNRDIFDRAMQQWLDKFGMPREIVEGCARGADSMAERWARARGAEHDPIGVAEVVLQHFPADWNRHGRAAGAIRNQQMLDYGPDACIAFTPDLKTSRGTRDMVIRSRRAGLRVWLPVAGSDDPTAR